MNARGREMKEPFTSNAESNHIATKKHHTTTDKKHVTDSTTGKNHFRADKRGNVKIFLSDDCGGEFHVI